MAEKGVLIVVSGFSGAGKGTIVKKIVSECPELSLSISMTTREPREGETEGKSYFFVSKERFEEAISNGELLEFATFVGNYYGTPRAYVEEMISQGKDVILEIEMQGAIQVKTRFPEAILIFVTPPSAHELKRRLTERGTEDEATINKRMHRAYEESGFIDRYDYLLVNDDLDKCVEELRCLIEASHHKPDCSSGLLKKINEELQEYV